MNRKTILNIPIDTYQPEEFYSKIENSLTVQETKTIFAVNPEKVMHARVNKPLEKALQEADFLIPDGVGVVLALKALYDKKVLRTTGIGLLEKLLQLAEKRGSNVFFYGAKPSILEKAIENFSEKFPNLKVAGFQHGFLPDEKMDDLITKINSSKTDILFVGLGSPKQENWISKNRHKLDVKICMGVGGSFDVWAGTAVRAPSWIQKFGLEWAYRLIRQPSRIKRQMVLPFYAFKVFSEVLQKRRGGVL